MKVILISKVANYGNIGDVIDVKDGYARNFLIPNKKAIYFSKANYKSFEEKKKEFEAKNKEFQKHADEAKLLIDNREIVVIENASDDGRLYGAVTNGIILSKITEIAPELSISKADIILEKPIKETGVYNISVNLYADVTAKLNLVVARNASEVSSVIKQARLKADQKKAAKEFDSDFKNNKEVVEETTAEVEIQQEAVAA